MKIINLTPHAINIILDGDTISIPSSGVARAKSSTEQIGSIGDIPVYRTVYGETCGIPEPQAGVVYIVSSLAAQGCKDRSDIYVPSDPVRGDDGNIIGCRGLAVIR